MRKKILTILVFMQMLLATTLIVTGQTIEKNQQENTLPTEILPIDKLYEKPESYQFLEEEYLDVEQYIWDEKNKEWVDADTQNEAFDVPSYSEVTFKIVLKNIGAEPLAYIDVLNTMGDDLDYISAEPTPDYIDQIYPFWFLYWMFEDPLYSGESIVIYITGYVDGPECDYDYGLVEVYCGGMFLDADFIWMHTTPKSRTLNNLVLDILKRYPYIFPLLQKLLFTL